MYRFQEDPAAMLDLEGFVLSCPVKEMVGHNFREWLPDPGQIEPGFSRLVKGESAEAIGLAVSVRTGEPCWKACHAERHGDVVLSRRWPIADPYLASPAELRVAWCLGRGFTVEETAKRLYISRNTVSGHICSLRRKYGQRSTLQLSITVATLMPALIIIMDCRRIEIPGPEGCKRCLNSCHHRKCCWNVGNT